MSEVVTLHEATKIINKIPANYYWAKKLPSGEDYLICKICSVYQKASSDEQREFRKDLEMNGWQVLWAFLRRAAMLGVRERTTQWIVCGLISLTICAEDPETEPHDVLIDLAILYHSACQVGDPRHIFEAGVQHVEDERIRQLILGFLDRDPWDQRPEAMGWEVILGPSGLIYRFDNQPIPEGHL